MSNTEKKDLFWEDLKIGQTYTSGTLTLDKDEMIAYAKIFDPQPMHIDEEKAKDSFFGRLIGSGWHALSSTIRLMAESKPFGETPLVGMEVDKIRFMAPLLPDVTLRAKMEIVELKESKKPGRGYVRVHVTTTADDKPIVSQEWFMLMPTR